MPTARLFIAIDLSPELIRELSSCRRALSPTLDGIRWVGTDALHLTLCFLGDTPVERLDGLREAVAVALTDQVQVAAEVRGVGVFPNARRPAVLWAGVSSGAPALTALAGRLQAALQAHGFGPDPKPFAAHVTLGRFRRDARVSPRAMGELLERWRETRFGGLAVDRVVLYASTLTPTGPVYEALHAWALAPEAG